MSTPFVSVIIPVLNDSEGLKTCLKALEDQTYSTSLYEVIVVDNGSDEDIKGVVNQFNQFIKAVVVFESHPGSYAARNKGISVAKGEVLAFTDADCVPAIDWIEKGVANLLRVPNSGLVGGKVEMTFKNPEQPTAVELFDSTNFDQKLFVEQGKYAITANVFTFRSVIEQVGSFDDSLKSCGDQDWGRRVAEAGYQLIYGDDTCVSHPARYSYGQLYRRYMRVLGGTYDLKVKRGYSFNALLKDAVNDFKPPITTVIRILLGKEIGFYTYHKVNTNGQKLQFILVILLIRYGSGWEQLRLLLGGKSRRS